MAELFTSDRFFKVWQYTVSHRRLLLRSTGDNIEQTRIDIYFANVTAMLLRPYYEGLTIRAADEDEYDRVERTTGERPAAGRLHVLGSDLTSFVVSAPPQWHEDEGSYRDPSWFGSMPGTE